MEIKELIYNIQHGGKAAENAWKELIGFSGEYDTDKNWVSSSKMRRQVENHIRGMFTKDEKEIEAIFSDFIERIIKGIPKLKTLDGINGWFWKAVNDSALDFLRKKGVQSKYFTGLQTKSQDDYGSDEIDLNEILIIDDNDGPEEKRERSDLQDCIENGLNQLDAKYRQIIYMRFFKSFSIDEIKDRISRTYDATKTIVYESVKKIKPLIETCR